MLKKITPILISIFLDALGFSFIFPIIPFIIQWYHLGVTETGLAISIAAIGMGLWGVIFWRISDRYGRKPLLILSIISNIFGYILLAWSSSFTLFLIARLLSGIGGWWVAVAQAYIGDVVEKENRIHAIGYVWAAMGIGFTAGPLFGSLLIGENLHTIGYISASVLTLSLLNILFFLPKNSQTNRETIHINMISHAKMPIIILGCILFLVWMTTAGMQTILGWFLLNEYKSSGKEVALIFGYMGIVAIIYQGFLLQYVRRYLSEIHILIVWLILISIWLIISGWIHISFPITIIGITLTIIGISNTNTSIFALITQYSSEKKYWENMWLTTLFTSLADMIGPILISRLYSINIWFPFYFLACIIFFLWNLLIWGIGRWKFSQVSWKIE